MYLPICEQKASSPDFSLYGWCEFREEQRSKRNLRVQKRRDEMNVFISLFFGVESCSDNDALIKSINRHDSKLTVCPICDVSDFSHTDECELGVWLKNESQSKDGE